MQKETQGLLSVRLRENGAATFVFWLVGGPWFMGYLTKTK